MHRLRSSTFLAIASLLLFTSCLNTDAVEDASSAGTEVFSLGMSIENFLLLFPDAQEEADDQYTRTSQEFGVRGEWIYSFHDNRLSWYLFNAHQSDISEASFNRTFDATEKLIKNYSESYGTPWREDYGFAGYIDPRTDSHSGYKVREAHWRTDEGRITVDFTFLGESGVFSLLLTVQATS